MKDREATRKHGLARTLSKLGYCSRSSAAELIRSGRVTLNGRIRRDPEAPVLRSHDQVAVDGKLVEPQTKIYLMMNKPRGLVTTASDEKGHDTVYTMLYQSVGRGINHEGSPWIAAVGRLDKASEGLLLFTNDSQWAAGITAPETHLDKTYHVQVADLADEEFFKTLVRGVKTTNGETLRSKQARRLRAGEKNCWLEIILDEGKNRHIRRMMDALGIEVLRLMRVAIGPLQLGDLAKGEHRSLTTAEKGMLDRAMRKSAS